MTTFAAMSDDQEHHDGAIPWQSRQLRKKEFDEAAQKVKTSGSHQATTTEEAYEEKAHVQQEFKESQKAKKKIEHYLYMQARKKEKHRLRKNSDDIDNSSKNM